MRSSPRMQARVKKSKGRASLAARNVCLANWRAYHIMQSAGNLRRKRRERVEGEDERGRDGGRRAWRKMRNYWRLIMKQEGMERVD